MMSSAARAQAQMRSAPPASSAIRSSPWRAERSPAAYSAGDAASRCRRWKAQALRARMRLPRPWKPWSEVGTTTRASSALYLLAPQGLGPPRRHQRGPGGKTRTAASGAISTGGDFALGPGRESGPAKGPAGLAAEAGRVAAEPAEGCFGIAAAALPAGPAGAP